METNNKTLNTIDGKTLILCVVRRSNGKRLIELRRAESDDDQGVPAVDPVDPVEATGGDLREVPKCGG